MYITRTQRPWKNTQNSRSVVDDAPGQSHVEPSFSVHQITHTLEGHGDFGALWTQDEWLHSFHIPSKHLWCSCAMSYRVCECMYVCVYMYVYIYIYICMYICMYVCICTYIHIGIGSLAQKCIHILCRHLETVILSPYISMYANTYVWG